MQTELEDLGGSGPPNTAGLCGEGNDPSSWSDRGEWTSDHLWDVDTDHLNGICALSVVSCVQSSGTKDEAIKKKRFYCHKYQH